jgi:hypothetical protein
VGVHWNVRVISLGKSEELVVMKLLNTKYSNPWLVAVILSMGLLFCQVSEAESSPTALAIRLFNRLAVQINGDDPRVAQMAGLISAGGTDNLRAAAAIPLADHKFGNTTLFSYFAPMSNLTQSVVVPLNDMILTGIAMVWNGESYKNVVAGTEEYTLNPALGLPAYNSANNNHYAAASTAGVDYVANLVSNQQTILNASTNAMMVNPDPAGLLTSNTWIQVYNFMDTNRNSVKYLALNFLGIDINNVRVQNLPWDRVNWDVDRAPGGDPNQFVVFCATCHCWIDPMRSAFNHYDAPPTNNQPGAPIYNPSAVVSKITATDNFVDGFEEGTQPGGQDEWEFRNPLSAFGWNANAPLKGNGVNSLGQALAQSSSFALNAVTRVWNQVCPNTQPDPSTMQMLGSYFGTTLNYDLRALFGEIAIRPECLGN